MGAGRAGAGDSHVRALGTEGDRDQTGGRVGQEVRQEHRRNPIGSALEQNLVLREHLVDAPRSRAEHDPDAVGAFGGHVQARVSAGFLCRDQCELRAAVHVPQVLGRDVHFGLEVLDLTADAHAELGRVEQGDGVDAGTTGKQVSPGLGRAVAHRRDGAEASDHDTARLSHTGSLWRKRKFGRQAALWCTSQSALGLLAGTILARSEQRYDRVVDADGLHVAADATDQARQDLAGSDLDERVDTVGDHLAH